MTIPITGNEPELSGARTAVQKLYVYVLPPDSLSSRPELHAMASSEDAAHAICRDWLNAYYPDRWQFDEEERLYALIDRAESPLNYRPVVISDRDLYREECLTLRQQLQLRDRQRDARLEEFQNLHDALAGIMIAQNRTQLSVSRLLLRDARDARVIVRRDWANDRIEIALR